MVACPCRTLDIFCASQFPWGFGFFTALGWRPTLGSCFVSPSPTFFFLTMPLSNESAVVFLAILVFVLSSVEQGRLDHFFLAQSHGSVTSMCMSCCHSEMFETNGYPAAM